MGFLKTVASHESKIRWVAWIVSNGKHLESDISLNVQNYGNQITRIPFSFGYLIPSSAIPFKDEHSSFTNEQIT